MTATSTFTYHDICTSSSLPKAGCRQFSNRRVHSSLQFFDVHRNWPPSIRSTAACDVTATPSIPCDDDAIRNAAGYRQRTTSTPKQRGSITPSASRDGDSGSTAVGTKMSYWQEAATARGATVKHLRRSSYKRSGPPDADTGCWVVGDSRSPRAFRGMRFKTSKIDVLPPRESQSGRASTLFPIWFCVVENC